MQIIKNCKDFFFCKHSDFLTSKFFYVFVNLPVENFNTQQSSFRNLSNIKDEHFANYFIKLKLKHVLYDSKVCTYLGLQKDWIGEVKSKVKALRQIKVLKISAIFDTSQNLFDRWYKSAPVSWKWGECVRWNVWNITDQNFWKFNGTTLNDLVS